MQDLAALRDALAPLGHDVEVRARALTLMMMPDADARDVISARACNSLHVTCTRRGCRLAACSVRAARRTG